MVNPVGAVPIFDGGFPRIITANAAVGVTGGQLVYLSGGNNVVSSGADTFAASDLQVIGQASGINFNGIVITPGLTASGTNNYVAIGMGGTYIINAIGSVIAGQAVEAQADGVLALASGTSYANGLQEVVSRKCGRALTNATSGTALYAVVTLTP